MKKTRYLKRYTYRLLCNCVLYALALVCFSVAWFGFVVNNNQTGHLLGYGNLAMAYLVYLAFFICFHQWIGSGKLGVERKTKSIAGIILTVLATNFVEIFVSMAITGQFRFALDFIKIYSVMSLIQAGTMIILLIIMIDIYRKIIPPIKMLVIEGDYKNNLAEKIADLRYKYRVSKVIHIDQPEEQLFEEIKNSEAVLLNDIVAEKQNDIVKKCFELDKRIYVVPKLSEIILRTSENLNVVDTPLYLCRNLGIKWWQVALKRFCDIVFSFLALVILSPLFIITMLAIKLEDGGPVFFRQERVTLREKHFNIIKFRSMIVDAEKDGRPHPAGEKDDRITKVGRIIRACRIDELPQLFNILRGDMSIVGPRPERWEHVEKYTREIPEFLFRHKVKGGLTGYAQVYGKYNTSALDKLKLDLIYITNYSLLLDIQILFETLKILFQKESTEGFVEEQIEEISAYSAKKEN